MSFIRKGGAGKERWMPVTPSTALLKNSLVTFTSGKLVAVTAGTAAADIIGNLERAIVAADTDYASDRLVPVYIPTERFNLFEADVTTGLLATDVGTEVDLTDSATVNRGASSVKAVKIMQRISATKAMLWIKFSGAY